MYVIGGGPAGCLTAITAAKRGHHVTLIEKTNQLGGQIVPGSQPAIKFDIQLYLDWLRRKVAEAERDNNLTVLMNTTATSEWVLTQQPDSVVVAVGSSPVTLPIAGQNTNRTMLATDLLVHPEELEGRAARHRGGWR